MKNSKTVKGFAFFPIYDPLTDRTFWLKKYKKEKTKIKIFDLTVFNKRIKLYGWSTYSKTFY